jgi:hypothetical protein
MVLPPINNKVKKQAFKKHFWLFQMNLYICKKLNPYKDVLDTRISLSFGRCAMACY